MSARQGSRRIEGWPEESRKAARLVIDQYGEPRGVTETQPAWHRPGPWKRIVATKACWHHDFPAPHIDAVGSFIDHRVPVDRLTQLAEFDGSVVVERAAGEVAPRRHDEQANFLALNLMHDIVTGAKNVQEARGYCAKEFADFRRRKPTPYMERLRFAPGGSGSRPPHPVGRAKSHQGGLKTAPERSVRGAASERENR